jgi:hypothetical protein
MKLFLFLICFPQLVFAINANINFFIVEQQLVVEYEFSEELVGFEFTYPSSPDRNLIFNNLPEITNNIVPVSNMKLTLITHDLDQVSLAVQSGSIFYNNSGDAMILTDLFEMYLATNDKGEQAYIEKLNYYYNGELLHIRDVYDGDTWERYLIFQNEDNALKTPYGDILIDTDMPNRDKYIGLIKKSLKFINEKLGKPYKKARVFVNYESVEIEPWWEDGRVIQASPYIQIALGGELDETDIAGKIKLYHALMSHEIVHHWNARNLADEGNSWIHEGGAEALSTLVSKALYADELGEWVDYMERSNIQQCNTPDEDFDYAYHCGNLIFSKVIKSMTVDPFQLFKELHKLPKQTNEAVLGVFKKYTTSEIMLEIQNILSRKN